MSEYQYIHCPKCGESDSRSLPVPGERAAAVIAGGVGVVFVLAGIATGGFFWMIGGPVVMPAIMIANEKIQAGAGAREYRCNNCLHTWR